MYGDTANNLAYKETCNSSTMSDGKACSFANCGFITTVTVPYGVELDEECQCLQLQQQELAKHSTRVHNTGKHSTTTDVAVDPTTVAHTEYDDAAATIAYKEPCHSPTCRSNKYRKRHKSRRSDADANCSSMFLDVDEAHYAVLS